VLVVGPTTPGWNVISKVVLPPAATVIAGELLMLKSVVFVRLSGSKFKVPVPVLRMAKV